MKRKFIKYLVFAGCLILMMQLTGCVRDRNIRLFEIELTEVQLEKQAEFALPLISEADLQKKHL